MSADEITSITEKEAEAAGLAAKGLARFREAKAPIRLRAESSRARRKAKGSEENEVVVPAAAIRLFTTVLEHLARGQAVTVLPLDDEITTQEAADLLRVSRPYLVKLLDQGAIPHRKVGNRRRVQRSDVLAYKQKDEAKRNAILEELTAEAQELGLGY